MVVHDISLFIPYPIRFYLRNLKNTPNNLLWVIMWQNPTFQEPSHHPKLHSQPRTQTVVLSTTTE